VSPPPPPPPLHGIQRPNMNRFYQHPIFVFLFTLNIHFHNALQSTRPIWIYTGPSLNIQPLPLAFVHQFMHQVNLIATKNMTQGPSNLNTRCQRFFSRFRLKMAQNPLNKKTTAQKLVSELSTYTDTFQCPFRSQNQVTSVVSRDVAKKWSKIHEIKKSLHKKSVSKLSSHTECCQRQGRFFVLAAASRLCFWSVLSI